MNQNNPPVVVGLDDVAPTTQSPALRFAVDEAHVRGVGIRLVHGCASGARLAGYGPSVPEERTQRGQTLLHAAADLVESMTHGDVPVDVVNSLCSGTEALLEASSSATLVVVQRRTRGTVSRLVAGSTASLVAAQAECPVVVVRMEGHPSASGAVVVGVDSRGHSQGAVLAAASEASWRSVPLVAVQAWEARFDPPTAAGYVPPDDVELEIARNNAAESLAEALAGLSERYPDVPTSRQLIHGAPIDCLLAAAHDAGLLVVGRHASPHLASAGLGRVARSLIGTAPCPVMVTPPGRVGRLSSLLRSSVPVGQSY